LIAVYSFRLPLPARARHRNNSDLMKGPTLNYDLSGKRKGILVIMISVGFLMVAAPALAQDPGRREGQEQSRPWMDPNLSPDQRADMVIAEMTLDE
jgi:hypothetical protein